MDKEIHQKFVRFCHCNGNAKAKVTEAMFDREDTLSFTRYFESLGKCKSLGQWKISLEGTKFPAASAKAARSIADVGRFMVLQFIANTQTGEAFGAEIATREHYMDEEYQAWIRDAV